MKIATVFRGDLVENTHYGHIAVVNAHGEMIESHGQPHRLTHSRSTMKPFQTIPLIESGAADHFQLDLADIALCCGSHSSEEIHAEQARLILAKAGLTEKHLRCGGHPPLSKKEYNRFIFAQKTWIPIYSACSGKHAGMLATAKHLGYPIDTYEQVDHPLQQKILSVVSEMTSTPKHEIVLGIDGCGTPVFGLPLQNLALAYMHLANPSAINDTTRQSALRQIGQAMVTHPNMVAGEERFCTTLMEAFNGRLIGKMGADGVYALADLHEKIGISIKVEDGNLSILYQVVTETLKKLGIGNKEIWRKLDNFANPNIYNSLHQAVGKIEIHFMES